MHQPLVRWLLLVLCSLPLLQACGERKAAPWRESDELVVLTSPGPLTYTGDPKDGKDAKEDKADAGLGFEHDLVSLFAAELGRKLRLEVVGNYREVPQALRRGKGHMAAAWLVWHPGSSNSEFQTTTPFFHSSHLLVQHEASLPITTTEQLAGRTVHVVARSRHADLLASLPALTPPVLVQEHPEWSDLDLLQAVAEQRIELALTDGPVLDIAQNYYPQLTSSLEIGEAQPITWMFPSDADPELVSKAEAFLGRIHRDGTLTRLKDRYFGHVRRLKQLDVVQFLERTRSLLPDYRPLFESAQARTGIDWRLIAALAYQESQWDPLATSPTGVRGMMMLTEETADRLGVGNRLDPKQSISAGARYLADIRDQLPATLKEPDRTWMALAAYNLGLGHMKGGLAIAPSAEADPDSWFEMKRVLPLLSRPDYYRRLKSGRARGGEAVIMVENIRIFYDILNRHEPPYFPPLPPPDRKNEKKGDKKGKKRH